MKQLIEDIAKALVDIPEEVAVNVIEGEQTTVLELKVAPEDVGKVIGRDGRTINAMRAVLAVAALRRGAKVRLEVLDDRRGPTSPGTAAPSQSSEPSTEGEPEVGGAPPSVVP